MPKRDPKIEPPQQSRWLLLIHNIPPKPAYFRVKIWRKIGALGAVAIKNSVYALPKTDACQESFQWLSREIIQGGGDATLCEALFIEGIADSQIERMFNEARNREFQALSEEARALSKKQAGAKKKDAEPKAVEAELLRFKRRFSEITAVDYFGASGRESAEALLGEIEAKLRAKEPGNARIGSGFVKRDDLQGRVWVTRQGIHVDRIASAWLIRRFIDERPKFRFVDGKTHKPKEGELRFDMFEAEFTHEGDLCTFEVLLARTHLVDAGLKQIAEVIHNIDVRDHKYSREDTPGIEQLINGICMAHKEDEVRLQRGSALLDDLYEFFKRKNR
jgi:hypothetical protein